MEQLRILKESKPPLSNYSNIVCLHHKIGGSCFFFKFYFLSGRFTTLI